MVSSSGWPGPSLINFIHNWRCAGTTLNSILSCNYRDHYLKIGHPFDSFGWPQNYKKHAKPIITLGQIRSLISSNDRSNFLVGGHSFVGLESFLPGATDIWMNYREPISRLNSGILRFYSRKWKSAPTAARHLLTSASSDIPIDLTSPDSIDHLLSTVLMRESNGMSRRLAAMSLTPTFTIDNETNIETVDMLTSTLYDSNELLEAAKCNLQKVRVLINSKYLQASIISIEKIYGLASPLINPFSDLNHNPVTLSGVSKNNTTIIDNCKPILEKHSDVDAQIYSLMNEIFADQVNQLSIDTKEVEVREAIHREAIFHPDPLQNPNKYKYKNAYEYIGDSIARACLKNTELCQDMYDTFAKWRYFEFKDRALISKYCCDKYSLRSKYF